MRRVAFFACLVGLSGAAGCELAIPPDQYQGESRAAGSDGIMTPDSTAEADAGDAGAPADEAASDAAEGADLGAPPASDTGAPDSKADVSTPDGARPTEGGARPLDASTGASPKDGAARDAQGDVRYPDGATAECHLACDDTFCCSAQVCCPSVCGTNRCVLAPTCPNSANVACN